MSGGQERWTSGDSPTDFTFTGQRSEMGFGLMDYNARYYSAYLGRFVSPDSIVPGVENPQAWNRYAYTFNNPLNYTDSSGHCPPCDDPWSPLRSMWDQAFGPDAQNGLVNSVDSIGASVTEALTVAYKGVSNLAGQVSRQLPPDPYGFEGTTWPFDESSFNEGYQASDKLATELASEGIELKIGIVVESSQWRTVSRWMSPAEYEALVKTGQLSPDASGGKYILNESATEIPGAVRPGSLHVEFKIPVDSRSAVTNGDLGWEVLYTDQHIRGRLDALKGNPAPPELPVVKDINIRGGN